MSPLLATTPDLPLGQSGKFVAGAYIVAFVVILIYVVIMAIRAQRVERDLEQLQRDVEAVRASADRAAADGPAGEGPRGPGSAGDPERSGSLL